MSEKKLTESEQKAVDMVKRGEAASYDLSKPGHPLVKSIVDNEWRTLSGEKVSGA